MRECDWLSQPMYKAQRDADDKPVLFPTVCQAVWKRWAIWRAFGGDFTLNCPNVHRKRMLDKQMLERNNTSFQYFVFMKA